MTAPERRSLTDLVVADSGTWGDEADENDGSPVLRSTNIHNFELDLTDCAWRRIPERDAERKRLADGDILVTASSGSLDHIGKCCLFRQPPGGRPYYFSNFILRLRPRPDRLEPRWLFYWLSSSRGRAALASMNSTTSGLRNLNKSAYLTQRVPLLPLGEQRRIAAILDKADGVRRKRQGAIRMASEFLSSAFLEMFGDPVLNPRGWPSKQLTDLVRRGGSIVDGPFGSSLKPECYVDAGVRVIRNFNIGDDLFDDSEFKYVTSEKFSSIKRSEVRPGDILISTKGTVGNVCLMPSLPGPSVLSASGTVRIRLSDSAELLNDILVSQMILPSFKQRVKSRQAGSNQKYLNLSAIKSFEVIVPPLKLQDRFSELKAGVAKYALRLKQTAQETETLVRALQSDVFGAREVAAGKHGRQAS